MTLHNNLKRKQENGVNYVSKRYVEIGSAMAEITPI